jgi:hypothetical protein
MGKNPMYTGCTSHLDVRHVSTNNIRFLERGGYTTQAARQPRTRAWKLQSSPWSLLDRPNWTCGNYPCYVRRKTRWIQYAPNFFHTYKPADWSDGCSVCFLHCRHSVRLCNTYSCPLDKKLASCSRKKISRPIRGYYGSCCMIGFDIANVHHRVDPHSSSG